MEDDTSRSVNKSKNISFLGDNLGVTDKTAFKGSQKALELFFGEGRILGGIPVQIWQPMQEGAALGPLQLYWPSPEGYTAAMLHAPHSLPLFTPGALTFGDKKGNSCSIIVLANADECWLLEPEFFDGTPPGIPPFLEESFPPFPEGTPSVQLQTKNGDVDAYPVFCSGVAQVSEVMGADSILTTWTYILWSDGEGNPRAWQDALDPVQSKTPHQTYLTNAGDLLVPNELGEYFVAETINCDFAYLLDGAMREHLLPEAFTII